nr:antA/AntB antirepressor family protein [Corynebacterium neomassiliense]
MARLTASRAGDIFWGRPQNCRSEYGFVAGQDFTGISLKTGGRPRKDHILTLDSPLFVAANENGTSPPPGMYAVTCGMLQ